MIPAGLVSRMYRTPTEDQVCAAAAADRINELARNGADAVFRAGGFIRGTTVPDAGPLWADTTTELLPGWADRHMPFSQIHGHNSITPWREHESAVPRTGSEALVTLDVAAKHEMVHLAGGRLIGIDPDHRETPTTPWQSFELIGDVTAR